MEPVKTSPPSAARRLLRTMWCMMLAILVTACGDAMETPFGMTEEATAGDAASSTSAAPEVEDDDAPAAADTTAAESGGDDGTITVDPEAAADGGVAVTDALQGLAFEVVASDLQQPTAVAAPVGDDRLFVVERIGVIRLIDEGGDVSAFMDLTDRVLSNGLEQGLLGLAFHPEYAGNGRFFVYYTDQGGRRQLSEFAVSDDADRGDPDSEKVLFELEQPADSLDVRHYGGSLDFGPDGYLYVSLGDGADARGQGQNPDSMFAAIVRLDVDGGDPYAIPADNPFVNGGGAGEVWAYGLRNPWRFAIDHEERLIYVADVGQENWEEVNVVALDTGGGSNFGWITTEGAHCFSPSDCDMSGLTLPVLEYSHDEGCSITGGYVYRGAAIPELNGHYFYADWCGLWVRSFRYEDGVAAQQQDWSDDLTEAGQVNTFGLDGYGELYIANFEGSVMRIVPVR